MIRFSLQKSHPDSTVDSSKTVGTQEALEFRRETHRLSQGTGSETKGS